MHGSALAGSQLCREPTFTAVLRGQHLAPEGRDNIGIGQARYSLRFY